jgi:fatty-acyl-CoA synthase
MIYGDWIGRWGRAFPETEALVDVAANRRYTYGQLAHQIDRLAGFLRQELGIVRGDRVACLSFNRAEYISLFFSLSRIGAILVPLNFRLAPSEFTYYLKDASPRAIFFDQEHGETVAGFKAATRMEYVCFDDESATGISLSEAIRNMSAIRPAEIEIGPEDPQLIIYTSGTTGLPKGVVLTHGMITWNAINTQLGWGLRPCDRTVLHAAMFYTAGWNVFTLPLFYCRGANLVLKGFDADRVLDLIGSEKITVFFGVPTMFRMLMDAPKFGGTDFSGVRFLVSGGAPLGHEIIETFQEKKSIRIWEGYGMTEVGPNNFMANGKPGTVGHPMPHVDVRIAGIDGRPLPAGQDGEIRLRGHHACAGYWNKAEETAKAFEDGWFKTGDLGRMDGDGHVAIVGRLKDLIISGGVNIYPAEIERVIDTHPAVAGSAVIGVPDPKWGEVGKAIVELNAGAKLDPDDLAAFLKDRLGKFKLPRYLAVVDSLPRTPASGKIQKFILKKKYGNPDNR